MSSDIVYFTIGLKRSEHKRFVKFFYNLFIKHNIQLRNFPKDCDEERTNFIGGKFVESLMKFTYSNTQYAWWGEVKDESAIS